MNVTIATLRKAGWTCDSKVRNYWTFTNRHGIKFELTYCTVERPYRWILDWECKCGRTDGYPFDRKTDALESLLDLETERTEPREWV